MSYDFFFLVRFGETKKYRDNATVYCSYKISVQSVRKQKDEPFQHKTLSNQVSLFSVRYPS